MRGVIFDLDGTLVDSLRDIADAMDHVLEQLELPKPSFVEYERFIGDGARLLVRRALGGRADLEEAALAAFRERYSARLTVHTRPFPGIAPLLGELSRRNVPSAVLSNKPHPATVKMVRELFPTHSFVAVLGHRANTPTKPDPSSALELARSLSIAPSNVLFVGDTAVDVQTARAAGMVPIGVAWGMRTVEELRDAGAAHVLDSPNDLVSLL
jgi:phosphoglycolate phosphatase